MIVQAYNDGLMRIFDAEGKKICDMEISPFLKSEADKKLRLLRMRRREPWHDHKWGSDAKIRFNR